MRFYCISNYMLAKSFAKLASFWDILRMFSSCRVIMILQCRTYRGRCAVEGGKMEGVQAFFHSQSQYSVYLQQHHCARFVFSRLIAPTYAGFSFSRFPLAHLHY